MIRYTLQCADGHRFEAWFPNSAAFDKQAAAGIVTCPDCASTSVQKSIMAPHIGKGGKDRAADPAEVAPSGEASVPAAPTIGAAEAPVMTVSGKLREALHEMKRYVEANAENVGNGFADEARKIHKGEAEERNIYGDTTEDEADALRDEGIPFGRIPWPKTSDA